MNQIKEYKTIIVEVIEDEKKATVMLNRPERLNGMNLPMVEELIGAFTDLKAADINVAILRGSGDKFSAGADLSEMKERSAKEWGFVVERYLDIIRAIIDVPVPVISAINGDAVGGGLGLCLASDIRIAKSSALLGFPFIKIGISGADMGSSYFLPKLVGHTAASDMLYTGKLVKADDAVRMGLINYSVSEEEFENKINEYVTNFTNGPGYAIRFTKKALVGSLDNCRARQFDLETFAQTQCLQTKDSKEGIDSFLKKRKPSYVGA